MPTSDAHDPQANSSPQKESGQTPNPNDQINSRDARALAFSPNSDNDFLEVVDFFNSILSSNFLDPNLPNFTANLTTIRGQAINELVPSLSINRVEDAYKNDTFDASLLPADLVSFLITFIEQFADFYSETLLQTTDDRLKKQALELLIRQKNLQAQFFPQGTLKTTLGIELDLAVKKGQLLKDSITSVVSLIATILDLMGVETPVSGQVVEAEVRDKSPEPTTVTTVVPKTTEQLDSGGDDSPQTQQQTEEETSQLAQDYRHQLDLFAQSFAVLTANSLIAAYTSGEDGAQIFDISLDQLSPETREILLREFQPFIKKIILSLDQGEVLALVNNEASAAAVRLKILQQAHRLATRNPLLRFLLQQAINESVEIVKEKGLEAELTKTIQQTNHEAAAQKLAAINNNNRKLSDEERQQLKTLSGFALLSADGYRNQFEDALAKLLGNKLDPTKIKLGIQNLNSSLTSLTITDPLLSESFVSSLSIDRLGSLFHTDLSSNAFTPEELAVIEPQLKLLFQQYWVHYRAEINKLYPQLAELNTIAPANNKLTEEEIDNTLAAQAEINQNLVAKAPPTTVEGEPTIAGRDVLDAFADSYEQPATTTATAKAVAEIKREIQQYRQKNFSQDYAAEVRIYNQLVRQRQQEQNREIQDYFAMVQAVAIHQQTQALTQALLQADQEQALFAQYQKAERERLIYNQNLAVLQHNRFLTEQDVIPTNYGEQGGQIGSQEQLNQQGQQYQSPTAQLAKKAALELADKGLMAATGGALAAIPGPIRKQILEKAGKKAKPLVKLAIGGSLAGLGAFLGLMNKIGASLVPVGVGSGMGFLLGGPVGAGLGFVVGTGISLGRLAGEKLGARIALDTGSLTSSIKGFGDKIAETAGLKSSTARATIPEAQALTRGGVINTAGGTTTGLASTATLPAAAAGSGVSIPLITKAASTLGLPGLVIGSTIGISSAATLLVMTHIASSFLINVDFDYLERAHLSMFADVSKTATIINEGSGCKGRSRCSEPNFPVEVEYSITFSPKLNSAIVIQKAEDTTNFVYNKDHHPSPPRTASITKSAQELGLEEVIGQEIREPFTVTYTEVYTEQDNHALIRNVVEIEFDYVTEGESGTNTIRGVASVTLGEAPVGQFCWPTAGIITQVPGREFVRGPYSGYNHEEKRLDAYDIAPTNNWKIYAPIDGKLCAGNKGEPGDVLYDRGYGVSVSIKTTIGQENYVLRFGHLVWGSATVSNKQCKDVVQGEVIGVVGSTGESTGPHLHFERARIGQGSLTLTQLLTGAEHTVPTGTHVQSCADLY